MGKIQKILLLVGLLILSGLSVEPSRTGKTSCEAQQKPWPSATSSGTKDWDEGVGCCVDGTGNCSGCGGGGGPRPL